MGSGCVSEAHEMFRAYAQLYPESQSPEPDLFFRASACIGCGKCIPVCPVGALSRDNPGFVDRAKCIRCGECTKVCPTEALKRAGRKMSVAEVMQELRKDAIHYRRSGGGVTLSGGEPLMQAAFAKQLLMACHEQGWNTAMETTGCATREVIREVIPHVDHLLMDLKSIDPAVHRQNTGVDNRIILENALIAAALTHAVVRVPVVPGVNDSPAAITAAKYPPMGSRGIGAWRASNYYQNEPSYRQQANREGIVILL